jgi:alpha-L-glutamate ligase-like protein
MGWLFDNKSNTDVIPVMGMNERNLRMIYANNPREHYALADDKILCKEILEKNKMPCAKTYGVIENIGDIVSGWESVQQYDKLAIKPANGSGGGGIKILRKNAEGQWMGSGKLITDDEIYFHLATIIFGVFSLGSTDRVLIEECIEPHSFFTEIYPQGVPDFRVIMLHNEPVMAMLRVPTDKSDGKANLHQGGLGIGIDIEKGLLMQAFDGKSYHDLHPDNGKVINGKIIEYWDDIVEVSILAARLFPLNYLGIDIVLDHKKGPMIMEINVRPGLAIQLANKKGLKQALGEKQLKY